MSELKNQELPLRPVCPLCAGTGKVTRVGFSSAMDMDSGNEPHKIVQTCRECKGSGRLYLAADELTEQLSAALDELRAKDTELAYWRKKAHDEEKNGLRMRDEGNANIRRLQTELAAQEARIAGLTRGPEFYAYAKGAISDTRLEGMIDETRWWKVPGDEVYEVVRELKDLRSRLRAVSESPEG